MNLAYGLLTGALGLTLYALLRWLRRKEDWSTLWLLCGAMFLIMLALFSIAFSF